MTSREVMKVLKSHGAVLVRQKGSHARFVSTCGKCRTTVPVHAGDVAFGTLRGIQSDMEPCFGKGWLLQ